MKIVIRIAVLALTLVAGVAIGAANTAPVAADPIVKTQTKTVTETVETTPQSCLDALDNAEAITGQTRKYVKLTVQMPNMIMRGLRAGMNMDVPAIDALTADIKAFTADTEQITSTVGPLIDDYNSDAAACRAAG